MSATAFIALGGNLGDRVATLRSAVAQLAATAGITVERGSQIYETHPVGPSNAPFVNAALQVHTDLQPIALLQTLHAIERDHGRERRVRWDARTLDLDLLLYFPPQSEQPLVSEDPQCRQPHPAMLERDFVLRPLADLVPHVVLEGHAVTHHLATLPEASRTILRTLEVDPLVQPG